jgi:hypothetical protein
MPKSIIDIDVNSDNFVNFVEMYAEYEEQLVEAKRIWGQTNEAIQATTGSIQATTEVTTALTEAAVASAAVLDAIAASVAATAISTAGMAKSMQDVEPAATRALGVFGTIAGHTKSVAGDILGATASLAKWATFSVGAGLLGAGAGLFGLDEMANMVSNQRKSAQGLGVTTAEQQAFNVNFGSRLVGSDFLSGVQNVKSDLSQQWMFQQLGIPMGEVQSSDTAQLGMDVIGKARSLWQQAGPGGHNQQWMQAHGLSGFMDYSTWQRIGQMSNGQFDQYSSQYNKDVGTMGASNQTQTEWQNFSVQMKRAGDQMESVFVTGLGPLMPQLTALSKSVEAALAGFLGNPKMGSWIDMIAGGIQTLAKWLGTPAFQTWVVNLASDIGTFGQELDGLVKRFKWLTPDAPSSAAPAGSGAPSGASLPGLPSIYGHGLDWSAPWKAGYGMNFTDVGKKYGLTPVEIKAMGMQESGLDPNAPDSAVGAQGMFQQTPGFQQQFGVSNPHNADQEVNALGMAMKQYLKKYHGNMAMALAAYNAGPGIVDAQIALGHANWFNTSLPASRQSASNFQQERGYVGSIAHRMGLTVKIINQTGSQTAVLANAVRQ